MTRFNSHEHYTIPVLNYSALPPADIVSQNPKVLPKIEKAIIGINQQKKAMIKQRLTSSVSIFFSSPYLTIRTIPRAPIPTTTIDHPTINHLKKSDTALRSLLEYWNSGILVIRWPLAEI
jgi:hypothetical protein